jgi:hypothetical protein
MFVNRAEYSAVATGNKRWDVSEGRIFWHEQLFILVSAPTFELRRRRLVERRQACRTRPQNGWTAKPPRSTVPLIYDEAKERMTRGGRGKTGGRRLSVVARMQRRRASAARLSARCGPRRHAEPVIGSTEGGTRWLWHPAGLSVDSSSIHSPLTYASKPAMISSLACVVLRMPSPTQARVLGRANERET